MDSLLTLTNLEAPSDPGSITGTLVYQEQLKRHGREMHLPLKEEHPKSEHKLQVANDRGKVE